MAARLHEILLNSTNGQHEYLLYVSPDDQLPQGSVNVTPAVATVRIQDFSRMFIKVFDYGLSV